MLQGLVEKIGVNRVVFALSMARLGDAIGNSLLFVVIPLYVARMPAAWFPASETIRVGVLISLFGFLSAVGEPLIGSLIDRIGHRKLMIQLGLLIMTGSLLGYIPVNRYVWLLVLRGVQAIGFSITVPATLALMAVVTHIETRGRAMGFYTTLRMLGMALGPLIGGYTQVHLGFAATFYVGAGCVVLAIVSVQVWVSERDGSTQSGEKTTEGEAKADSKAKGTDEPGFFDKRIWSAGVVGSAVATLTMASAFTIMATLEKQFDTKLHINAFLFSVAFSSLMVSRLLFQIPFGWLSDRWGRKPIIIGGLLLLAPSTALLGWATALWHLIALRILQGMASAGVAAPAFALAADSAREGGQGRQLSITTMGFSVGLGVGPLLAGYLVLYFFQLPFIVGGVLCVLGAWVILRFTPETVGRTVERPKSAT
jgi:MFS family permease